MPFWEKPLSNWEIFDTGLRAAFVASHHAAKIMVPQKSGLIVGISGFVGVTYTYDVIFGTTKSGMDRMMRDMGVELKEHNVAAVSLWQGFTYTERAQREPADGPRHGRAAQRGGRLDARMGRAGDRGAGQGPGSDEAQRRHLDQRRTGAEYGVTDVDGREIPSNRATRGSPIWGPV